MLFYEILIIHANSVSLVSFMSLRHEDAQSIHESDIHPRCFSSSRRKSEKKLRSSRDTRHFWISTARHLLGHFHSIINKEFVIIVGVIILLKDRLGLADGRHHENCFYELSGTHVCANGGRLFRSFTNSFEVSNEAAFDTRNS